MVKRTELETREAEGNAMIYAIEQLEKSWKQVLQTAEKKDKKIAISRIKGMLDGFRETKLLVERRRRICENPQNLKEEWDYWEKQKRKKNT